MAGPGDDFLFLQGSLGQLITTIINPYSGQEIFINEQKFESTGIYDGLAGRDFLIGTDYGDYINIVNNSGQQAVKNVEVFVAGDGGDVLQLAHNTITLNNVELFGGQGDDILWANAGDDLLSGFLGEDILDGGPGHDRIFGGDDNDWLYGGDDNDTLNGGTGSDLLSGDAGDDVLIYSGDAGWPTGFLAWNVGDPTKVINGDRVTVNPRYRNHDGFDGGEGEDTLLMSSYDEALFLDDRYSDNPFGYNTARLVDIEIIDAGAGNDIVDLTSKQFIYGDVTIYGRDGDDVLWANAGDDRIEGGNGNDHLDGASGDDILIGGAGDDKMYGRIGDDIFMIGEGADQVYTGYGADQVVYTALDGEVDTLNFFKTDQNDVLNITDILEGYDALSDAISDFVQLVDSGSDTQVHINADGDAGGAFTHIATITNGVDETLTELINNGNLVADQSVVV